MRSRYLVALAMTLMMGASSLLTSAASAQVDEHPSVDPALFDLDLARTELDELHVRADKLRADLDAALERVDALTVERDFISLNDQARNDVMQQSRTEARNMAITAYMGIGPPLQALQGAVVLDAESANDVAYRNGLLRHQAERLQNAATTYAFLAGEADQNVLDLSDSINDEIRRAEGLSASLDRTIRQIPHAEWVVSIAEIHEMADEAFARSRRPEPTAEQWIQLRTCESTETYNIDTGNTFYGAYQFTWETWGTVHGEGNPAHAPPEEQDARARLLYAERGSQPWPICGRFLP